jgi:hypothetical protein
MATRVAPTLEQIAQFMAIVTNPAHQPVYVHCAGVGSGNSDRLFPEILTRSAS